MVVVGVATCDAGALIYVSCNLYFMDVCDVAGALPHVPHPVSTAGFSYGFSPSGCAPARNGRFRTPARAFGEQLQRSGVKHHRPPVFEFS